MVCFCRPSSLSSASLRGHNDTIESPSATRSNRLLYPVVFWTHHPYLKLEKRRVKSLADFVKHLVTNLKVEVEPWEAAVAVAEVAEEEEEVSSWRRRRTHHLTIRRVPSAWFLRGYPRFWCLLCPWRPRLGRRRHLRRGACRWYRCKSWHLFPPPLLLHSLSPIPNPRLHPILPRLLLRLEKGQSLTGSWPEEAHLSCFCLWLVVWEKNNHFLIF